MRLGVMLLVLTVMWAGDVAFAFQCPALVKQAREALEQFKKSPGVAAVKDATVAAVETNLRNAEGAHDAGDHDEAMKQAKQALRLLGK